MKLLQYGQVVWLIVLLSILSVEKIQKKNMDKIRKDVFIYSVIPSLAYSTIGHLFLSKNIRQNMNWDNSNGVITLQRELGITQLAMFIIACISTKNPKYISYLWGLMLILMGMNHFIVTKKFNIVGLIDILYGAAILGLYIH